MNKVKISKSMRRQLLERAVSKIQFPKDGCWNALDLIPADCKLQEFWPLVEEWLEENCNNEPYSQYTQFGSQLYWQAHELWQALLGEYFALKGLLEAVEEEVWKDLYDSQNQDARCVLVKYCLLSEMEADVLWDEGFIPSSSYVPCTRYGKHIEECINSLTPVKMRG